MFDGKFKSLGVAEESRRDDPIKQTTMSRLSNQADHDEQAIQADHDE